MERAQPHAFNRRDTRVIPLRISREKFRPDVLHAVPIIFQLHHEQRTRMVAAFKRPSEADASKWVIDGYFAGGWLPTDGPRQALPVALDLQGLYEQLLRSLLPSPARPGESLAEQLQRLNRLRSLHSERAKLDARLHKEKQFNRKVIINCSCSDSFAIF